MAKILVLATICIVSLWTGQAHGRGVEVEDPIAVRAICRNGHPLDGYGQEFFKNPLLCGKLSEEGENQIKALGELLAKRYSHLLTHPQKILLESGAQTCIVSSARRALKQMLPNFDPTTINQQIIPLKSDHTLLMTEQCPRFNILTGKYMGEKDNKYVEYMRKGTAMRRRLDRSVRDSGEAVRSLTDVWKLWQFYNNQKYKKEELPAQAQKDMKEGSEFWRNAMFYYIVFTRKNEMKQLMSGPLLSEIWEYATSVTSQQEHSAIDYNFVLSFANDRRIASLMDVLDMFPTPHMPPYASCFAVEIYKGSGEVNEPHIKFVYLKSPTDIQTQYNSKCKYSDRCTLPELRQIYGKFSPGYPKSKSYAEACQLQEGDILPRIPFEP